MNPCRVVRKLAVLSLGLALLACGGGGNPIFVAPVPELALSKTANPTTFDMPGQVVDYSFAVTNTGNAPVSGPITIDDDLTTNEACPALTTVGNGDDRLDPGETITCTASYTIVQADVDAGSVTNTASASGLDPDGGTATSDPDSVRVAVPLVATFTADPASADPRISMQPGPSNAAEFTILIFAADIDDLYGTAFTLAYDPTKATWLGCDAAGSILTTSGAGSIPCDDALVGGAKFRAELQNGMQGLLNVRASKDGLVPGVVDGTGLLLALTFRADVAIPVPGEPFEFESGASYEIIACPQDLSACTCFGSDPSCDPPLPADGGTLTAEAG